MRPDDVLAGDEWHWRCHVMYVCVGLFFPLAPFPARAPGRLPALMVPLILLIIHPSSIIVLFPDSYPSLA